jgi:hypothetical protein
MKTAILLFCLLLAGARAADTPKGLSADQKARLLEVQLKVQGARADRAEAEAKYLAAERAMTEARAELQTVFQAIQKEAGCENCSVSAEYQWVRAAAK